MVDLEIVDNYVKDIADNLERGLVASQANGSYGQDLIGRFEMMADYFKRIMELENELGVDLITLFKALKNGAWLRTGFMGTCYIDGKPIFIEPQDLKLTLYPYYYEERMEEKYCSRCQYETALCLHDMEYEDASNIAKVKDYGKTWALTKEELE